MSIVAILSHHHRKIIKMVQIIQVTTAAMISTMSKVRLHCGLTCNSNHLIIVLVYFLVSICRQRINTPSKHIQRKYNFDHNLFYLYYTLRN